MRTPVFKGVEVLGGTVHDRVIVLNNPVNWIDPFGLAPGDPYPTIDAAAIAAIKDINPTSIQQRLEYAGRIYKFWFSDKYSYTKPNKGTFDSSSGGLCFFTNCVAGYHTHGGCDSHYKNEVFSGTDIKTANLFGQPEYLGTPAGRILKYDPGDASMKSSIMRNYGILIGDNAK